MAKIAIKSEKLIPFGGIFPIMEKFDRILSPVIDNVLGQRSKTFGYQYSEIIRSLMCVYFCGGSCTEDLSSHLLRYLSLHPTLRTCSSDLVLRIMDELKVDNISYTSESGKTYDFNTADKVNDLLLEALLATGQLKAGEEYDFDFDHEFLKTEKYDAKHTYKKFLGYSPGVGVIGDLVVGIENRDGNANVRFHQQDTLNRMFSRLESRGIHINRARMDCGSCSKEIVEMVAKHCNHYYIRGNRCQSLYDEIFSLRGWKQEVINDIEFELCSIRVEKWDGVPCRMVIQRQRRKEGEELDLWEGNYTYRCILTNDYESTDREVVEYYNQRGAKERYFDDLDNGFGWHRLPKSFMNANAVFLILTALIRNFYLLLVSRQDLKAFGLKPTSRIKAFVFHFVTVPAKWVRTARQDVLNIYSENEAYAHVFMNDFG
jgi:hypothetical protein